jgi:hypothetical protein
MGSKCKKPAVLKALDPMGRGKNSGETAVDYQQRRYANAKVPLLPPPFR